MQLDMFAGLDVPVAPAAFASPNEFGSYSLDDAERLTLPVLKKGWRGMLVAEIELLQIPEGWIFGWSLCVGDTGYAVGLSSKAMAYATRSTALKSAQVTIDLRLERMRPRIETASGMKDHDRVLGWLWALQ